MKRRQFLKRIGAVGAATAAPVFIHAPGPFRKGTPTVAVPAPPDPAPSWDRMKVKVTLLDEKGEPCCETKEILAHLDKRTNELMAEEPSITWTAVSNATITSCRFEAEGPVPIWHQRFPPAVANGGDVTIQWNNHVLLHFSNEA